MLVPGSNNNPSGCVCAESKKTLYFSDCNLHATLLSFRANGVASLAAETLHIGRWVIEGRLVDSQTKSLYALCTRAANEVASGDFQKPAPKHSVNVTKTSPSMPLRDLPCSTHLFDLCLCCPLRKSATMSDSPRLGDQSCERITRRVCDGCGMLCVCVFALCQCLSMCWSHVFIKKCWQTDWARSAVRSDECPIANLQTLMPPTNKC